ncbi:HEPN family nuclease [Desulfobaculum sp. SPO524]|uniref:HEPN family nuclease n=1 Tax=Desulfobaculum sp. SPO524 TaxID=3378071 RepID=UPI003851F90B
MEYQQFLKDFVERTTENLKIIQEQKKHHDKGYEVTQLINSCLGLIVFVNENKSNFEATEISYDALIKKQKEHSFSFNDSTARIKYTELSLDKNDTPQKTRKLKHKAPTKSTLEHMRHSLAHSNIGIIAKDHQIKGLTLKNKLGGEKTIWHIAITIEEFLKLLDFLTQQVHEREE